jgi:hypothetical protein
VALLVAVAVSGAGVQSIHAQPSTKYYSTTIGGTPAAGATYTASITLANSGTSSQTLGSENVLLPVGYSASLTGASITAPSGTTWNLTLASQTLSPPSR